MNDERSDSAHLEITPAIWIFKLTIENPRVVIEDTTEAVCASNKQALYECLKYNELIKESVPAFLK